MLPSESCLGYVQKGEFYRVDTVGVLTQPGCLAALFGASQSVIQYYVVTFRKET